ncbi:MAG: dihydrofolate reductase [Gemmatimonadota bacterium]|nr:MAG: dihydrofolate reductase [Gemmatimonadota bacterium]
MISLIAAVAENRIIGAGSALPWHLPADMRHFKELTTGHTVIMGRKTFETLNKPLPRRRNVIITRDRDYHPGGVSVAHTLSEALSLAAGEREVFVAGGGEIYRLALPHANRLYLTVVHADFEGDTLFPEIDWTEWTLLEEERHEADENHAFSFSFKCFQRVDKRLVSSIRHEPSIEA